MNWDIVKGNWKKLSGKVREEWGDFTDNDIEEMAGRRDQLIGKLQEKYGYARGEAEQKADEWAKRNTIDGTR
jgi:uncharacterized protein YjbJ (UPF0337 family)